MSTTTPLTLPALLAATVARCADRPALVRKVDGAYAPITYRELADRVDAFSAFLAVSGVVPGDRVAILSENRPEWAVADLGLLGAGAVNVPLYTTLTPEQVHYILADSGAKAIVVSGAHHLQKVDQVRDRLPGLDHVLVMDAPEGLVGALPFGAALERGQEVLGQLRDELRQRREGLSPDHLASIVYTSGTTGEPKGAMLSHGNFAHNALACADVFDLNDQDRTLSFLPLSHVFERIAYYLAIIQGLSIWYAESLETIGANLQEARPTFLPAVPRVLEKLQARVLAAVDAGPFVKRELFWTALEVAKHVHGLRERGEGVPLHLHLLDRAFDKVVFKTVRERLGGHVRYVISGGAPLPKEVGEFYRALGLCVVEGYGLTETSPVIAVNPVDAPRLGTVGKVIRDVEVRLADDGELLVRGPNVMKGYWNKPDATHESIDGEGWFHTGDIARLDDDGYVAIVDRKKELIVMSNGKKVAPQPIENALRVDPLVEQAMLVGEGRNYMTALIVPNAEQLAKVAAEQGMGDRPAEDQVANPGVRAAFQRVVERQNAQLAPFEQLKTFALVPREWTEAGGELTPSLKLKRRVILAKHAPEIERMYGNRQKVEA